MKITATIKEGLISALKTGKFQPSDFPEFLEKEEIIFPNLDPEEKEFFSMLQSRINENPKFKEKLSPAVTIDRSLKVRILSSLMDGIMKIQDFPLFHFRKAVSLRFMLTREELNTLCQITEKHLNI